MEENTEAENSKDKEKEQAKPAESVDVSMTDGEVGKDKEREQEVPKGAENVTNTAHHDAAKTLVRIKEEEQVQEHSQNTRAPVYKVRIIEFSDVDPVIFGLFLRFIYTGFYPSTVDARPPQMHTHTPSPTPTTTNSTSPYVSSAPQTAPLPPYAQPALPPCQPVPFHLASRQEKTQQLFHILTAPKGSQDVAPAPAPVIAPPVAPTAAPSLDTFIPPSIHAYLLAHRLASPAFMNNTITHLYHAIGRDFALTPYLVDWVWKRTGVEEYMYANCPRSRVEVQRGEGEVGAAVTTGDSTRMTPPMTSTLPRPHSSSAPLSSPTGHVATPPFHPFSALRKLLLDILIQHWPSQASHIIARNQGDAWNRVFDAHVELRREMMMGLQGGVKVLGVEGYFVRMIGQGQEGRG